MPSYSYSESITPYFGTTGNAASGGTTWDMNTVLPTPPGLDINGVIYNYTIQKDVNDAVDVHVGNKNANGAGYIFRETDEWQPGSLGGTEIRKVVPVIPNIPRQAWGDGSIEVEGNGSVSDPTVVYMFKVDPCYDPQFDPNCPGYQIPIPEIPEISIEIYDATQDEYVNLNDDEKTLIRENENTVEEELEEDEEEEEKRKREYRLAALAATNAALLIEQDLRISAMNSAMQTALNNTYLKATIPGGKYDDKLTLVDKKIDENQRGLRNGLAQQLLHEKMVEMQYNNEEK